MKRIIEKFRHTGSIGDVKHAGHPKTSRCNVNIEAVHESDGENPGTSNLSIKAMEDIRPNMLFHA